MRYVILFGWAFALSGCNREVVIIKTDTRVAFMRISDLCFAGVGWGNLPLTTVLIPCEKMPNQDSAP